MFNLDAGKAENGTTEVTHPQTHRFVVRISTISDVN